MAPLFFSGSIRDQWLRIQSLYQMDLGSCLERLHGCSESRFLRNIDVVSIDGHLIGGPAFGGAYENPMDRGRSAGSLYRSSYSLFRSAISFCASRRTKSWSGAARHDSGAVFGRRRWSLRDDQPRHHHEPGGRRSQPRSEPCVAAIRDSGTRIARDAERTAG